MGQNFVASESLNCIMALMMSFRSALISVLSNVTYARKFCSRASKLSSCARPIDAATAAKATIAMTITVLADFMPLHLSNLSLVSGIVLESLSEPVGHLPLSHDGLCLINCQNLQ